MEQENQNLEQAPEDTGAVGVMAPPPTENPEPSSFGDLKPASDPEAEAAPPTKAEDFIRSLAPDRQGPEEAGQTEIPASAENGIGEEVQRVRYAALQAETPGASLHNIDYLKDVNLEAGVELGNTTMSVEQILGLGVGSIIELNQTVGEPVRLLINNHVYAQGEVVVIGDKFGIRISKISQT